MSYSYNYDFGDLANDPAVTQAAVGIGIALIIVAAIAAVIGIVLYIFQSLAFYTIAKNRNIPNPWMAWVPFCSGYLVGKIGDYYDLRDTGKSHNYALWILCLLIGAFVAPFTIILAFLSWFAIIAAAVLEYVCIYKFLKNVNPDSAVVMLVLSIIFSVAQPFILFSQRNKADIAPVPVQQPVYNGYQQPYQQPAQPQYQQPQQYQQPAQPQYRQPQQYQQPAQPQYQQPQQYQQPTQQQYQQPQAPYNNDNNQQ